jgi:hypothetical protein
MAKWHGKIGYSETVETVPGKWTDKTTELEYDGDVIRADSAWVASSDNKNDDLTISSQISIVADPFAYQKFHSMKWIEFMGTKWKIKRVEPKYPRLILTLGGVWNG